MHILHYVVYLGSCCRYGRCSHEPSHHKSVRRDDDVFVSHNSNHGKNWTARISIAPAEAATKTTTARATASLWLLIRGRQKNVHADCNTSNGRSNKESVDSNVSHRHVRTRSSSTKRWRTWRVCVRIRQTAMMVLLQLLIKTLHFMVTSLVDLPTWLLTGRWDGGVGFLH